MRRRGPRLAVCLVAATLLMIACTSGTRSSRSPSADPLALRILAGSELKDLAPLIPQMDQATGLHVELEYVGTLAGTEEILNGDANADLAWFSSNRYLTLAAGTTSPVVDQHSIMLSPVVIGVKRSLAQDWGWQGNANVTWADIEAKAADGELKYAMTNPAASNSGFSALVGVASALAGTGNALESKDVNVPALKKFFSGQALTAGSSGFLADSYVRDQASLGGIINYESVLLELNAGGKLAEPLTLIYPRDGIVTADYPLMLLNEQKRQAYDALVQFLLSADTQRWIMTHTERRPVTPGITLDATFPHQILVELPFPSSLGVVNDLLDAYLNEIRPPSHTFFLLDTSGSMEGDRLARLQEALRGLTGQDNSLTGVFSGFRRREQVTLIPFNDTVADIRDFQVDTTDPSGSSMQAIRSYVNALHAGGDTAIYSALDQAYRLASTAKDADPTSFESIVLMTDGENTAGMDAQTFLNDLRGLAGSAHAIPTYAVLFGDSDPQELEQIATATGGKVFDARTAPLADVFKEIRGYQ